MFINNEKFRNGIKFVQVFFKHGDKIVTPQNAASGIRDGDYLYVQLPRNPGTTVAKVPVAECYRHPICWFNRCTCYSVKDVPSQQIEILDIRELPVNIRESLPEAHNAYCAMWFSNVRVNTMKPAIVA